MQKHSKETEARRAAVKRRTKETAITASVDLDGTGAYDVATGVGNGGNAEAVPEPEALEMIQRLLAKSKAKVE